MLTVDEQAEFYAAIAAVKDAAQRQLAKRPFPDNVIHLYPQLHLNVDHLFTTGAAASKSIACSAGCSHCCHVKIEAKQPEVDYIARQLKQLSADELAHIVEHMRRGFEEKKAMAKVTPHRRGACVLLEDHRCMIYVNRPAVCRKGHSLDAQQCAAGATTIPQHLDLILKAEALIQGVGMAVAEVMPGGSSTASTEFADALWVALTEQS